MRNIFMMQTCLQQAGGNLKVDSLSHNYNMLYDWSTTRLVERNLLTHMWHWNFKAEDMSDNPKVHVFMSQYWYDEAGNRIRKEKYQWVLTSGSPDLEDPSQAEPVGEEESGSWVFVEAIYYIRDIAGREIAIYSGNKLEQCTKGVPSGEHVRIRQRWKY